MPTTILELCNPCGVFAEPLLLKRLGLPGKQFDEKASTSAENLSLIAVEREVVTSNNCVAN